MSEHAAILGLLQASGDLAALVGDRIYPDVMDEPPVYPSVTFQKMGGAGALGAIANPGLMRATFQVSTWAASRHEAAQIAALVRKALDRKRKVTVAGVRVDDCFYENDLDDKDPDDDIYYNHMSFKIHYRETT
jgi:hypothetical protein